MTTVVGAGREKAQRCRNKHTPGKPGMSRRPFVLLAAVGALATAAVGGAGAASLPTTWDNLVEVKAKNLKAVYLLPGADFRAYTKVMLDPTEVDFMKGWVNQMNTTYSAPGYRTTDADAERIAGQARKGVDEIFVKAFEKAGYPVVTEPGPDVLRVGVTVFNLFITAPSSVTMSGPGNVRTVDAGVASILITVRDSESGQVLGRGLDAGIAGQFDSGMPRSPVSNQNDFSQLFDQWASISVKGLATLKEMSPVDANAEAVKTTAK
jgi:hypothetical protein